MSLLLDTQAFFWLGAEPERLSAKARKAISEEAGDIFVSAASAWEVAIKVKIGKWPEAVGLEQNFETAVRAAGFNIIPITAAEALLAVRLPGRHKDPWDRILAAQSILRDIPIVSIDEKLDTFGVNRIW